VSSRLELPHVEDMGVLKDDEDLRDRRRRRNARIGGAERQQSPKPLPPSNIRQAGDTLTFDLVCEGHNQAIASAKYTLAAQRFDGAIAMKMGGKNMTMTERQSGHRVGACKAAEPPRT
jgi:hypothetical protein